MIFSSLNLEQELIRERFRQEKLVESAHQILEEAIYSDETILERLKRTPTEKELNLRLDESDRSRIFSLTDIRKISIRYRLRFLDSSFFKAEFPYEAVAEIKSFERKYGLQVK
ncbi:MAG: hypothetical protein ACHQHP_05780, partial [Bacteroidia bacterium]